MRKVVVFWVGIMVAMTSCAQQKPKIKGNKMVSDIFNTLEDFNSIEISDDLVVNIQQTGNNGYHLKADGNLVDVVKLDLVDGVLHIHTTHKITSFKELEITLTFDEIEGITLRDGSKLTSKNRIDLKKLDFQALDDAIFDLEAKAVTGHFKLHRSAYGNLKFKGDVLDIFMDGNASLKGDIHADRLALNINDRADFDVDGEVDRLKLVTTGTSDVRARKLKSVFAELNASNASDIHLYASKELKLYARGKSQVYVYGNPDIQVDGLDDKSQIIKKS